MSTADPVRRGASRAPATTFDKIRQPREWDDVFLHGLPAVALLCAAPLAVAIAATTSLTVRLLHRPWWAALPVAGIGLAWALLIGSGQALAGLIALPGGLVEAAGALDPAVALQQAAPHLLRDAAAASTLAGGTLAAGWRGWLALRAPTYRDAQTPGPRTRRIARTATTIAERRADPPDGVALGHRPDGRPVALRRDELAVHGLVVGGTGSGKTTAMLELLRCLVPTGGGPGLVYVDLKGDPALAERLSGHAHDTGRTLRLWTMHGPTVWNPLGRGDATEQRDKLMSALGPYSEAFYEAAARRYLQTVLNVLHHPVAGPPRPITLADVDGLFDLDALDVRVHGRHAEERLLADGDPLAAEVAHLLADYRTDRQLRSAATGWRTRLATLLAATVGRWLDGDGLDLHAALTAGDVVLFSLDASRYQDAAAAVARMVVRDLVTVAAQLQADRRGRTDGLAGTVVLDEFSAAAGDDLLALFARGRAAGVTAWLVTQDLADLDLAGPAFAAQVLANTNVKVIGRTDVTESAEALAALAGTEQTWEETVQVTTDAPHLAAARGGATGMGSLRRVDRFRIHPNDLKELPRGDAVVLIKHPRWRLERLTVIPTTPGTLTPHLPIHTGLMPADHGTQPGVPTSQHAHRWGRGGG